MGKKRFTSKTYLKLLIVVGLLAVIGGGAGTFATFNAEVTNPGNTFANGTLFLRTRSAASACTTGGGNTNTTEQRRLRTYLFSTTLSDGVSDGANLKLNNAGTIDASDMLNLTVGELRRREQHAETFHGTELCADLQLSVQETNDAAPHQCVKCWYGAVRQLLDLRHDLGHEPHSLAGFQARSHERRARSPPLALTEAGATRTSRSRSSRPWPPTTRFQNRKVTFDLTWHIDQ